MRFRLVSTPLLLSLLMLTSALLPACATMRSYGNAQRDPEDVAQLSPDFESKFVVQLNSVDGTSLRWYEASVELLPGRHSVSATAAAPMAYRHARVTHTLEFDAKAGHDYRVSADWHVYGLRLWIEEVSTGERVAEAVDSGPKRPPVSAYH